MPSTETEASQPTSKTVPSKQVLGQTQSGDEAQTKTQETTATSIDTMLKGLSDEKQEVVKEKEVVGILHVTFFKGNHFNIEVEGRVRESQVERALTGIYRAIGNSKITARRRAAAEMRNATSLTQDKPGAATA